MDREMIIKRVFNILSKRVGKTNAISAKHLYCAVFNDYIIPAKAQCQTRAIRLAVRELRKSKKLGIVSGQPGYWVAETEEELKAYTQKLLRTAQRSFGLAHQLSGVPIDRMVEQFKLDLENEANHDNE